MKKHVPSNEQLVVELYVQNLKKSIQFYRQLGFVLVRSEPHFTVLRWEDSALLLEQIDGQPNPPTTTVANIRIMVPDVDDYWQLCQRMELEVIRRIADRYYGLRDFSVKSPDGIGLRFATRIAEPEH